MGLMKIIIFLYFTRFIKDKIDFFFSYTYEPYGNYPRNIKYFLKIESYTKNSYYLQFFLYNIGILY